MAPALRAAGLRVVKVDGIEFELLPEVPNIDKNEWQDASIRRAAGNALDDFATFGGRRLPGFKRLREGDWGVDS